MRRYVTRRVLGYLAVVATAAVLGMVTDTGRDLVGSLVGVL